MFIWYYGCAKKSWLLMETVCSILSRWYVDAPPMDRQGVGVRGRGCHRLVSKPGIHKNENYFATIDYDSRLAIFRYSLVPIMQMNIVGMASHIPLIILSDSGDEIPPASPALPIYNKSRFNASSILLCISFYVKNIDSVFVTRSDYVIDYSSVFLFKLSTKS